MTVMAAGLKRCAEVISTVLPDPDEDPPHAAGRHANAIRAGKTIGRGMFGD